MGPHFSNSDYQEPEVVYVSFWVDTEVQSDNELILVQLFFDSPLILKLDFNILLLFECLNVGEFANILEASQRSIPVIQHEQVVARVYQVTREELDVPAIRPLKYNFPDSCRHRQLRQRHLELIELGVPELARPALRHNRLVANARNQRILVHAEPERLRVEHACPLQQIIRGILNALGGPGAWSEIKFNRFPHGHQ